LSRPRLGECDHVIDRLRRQLGVDRHDQRQLRDQDDRREILDRVIGQVGVDVRADAVGRDRVQEERVAVRIGFGDGRGSDRAPGAAAIAGDDRLAERVGKLGADDARDEVGGAARRHGDDELQRPVRIIVLRACQIGVAEDALLEDKGRDHE
jgi:hypothetical protein